MNLLHVGCGKNLFEGWVNLDLNEGDIKADVLRGLPFRDGSFDALFHEHFLEHLDYPQDATNFVRESYRVLKEGGIMRIGVPDTEYSLKAYVSEDEKYFEQCRELWHPEYCTTMMESINFHFRQAGQHKFAYDFETLEKLLSLNGFRDIKKAEFNDSTCDYLNKGTRGDPGTLWVECVR